MTALLTPRPVFALLVAGLLAVSATLLAPAKSQAADPLGYDQIVVTNDTTYTVTFHVGYGNQDPVKYVLQPGESYTFTGNGVGKSFRVTYSRDVGFGGGGGVYRLDPGYSYLFQVKGKYMDIVRVN